MEKDEILLKKAQDRLEQISKTPALKKGNSITKMLQQNGISRRDFMKWAGAMTTMLSLPASFVPLTAKAAEVADRLPVIWLHMAECTG
ncbi:MAG: twin-arginine translocation signal domain-containing protein, partial [Helicobacter sp.]|nr:twin-arginine translocation signal domain-containing protein [Helicobacter sp.]